jgi:hypothetical protein
MSAILSGTELANLKESALDVVQLRRVFLMLAREHYSNVKNYYGVRALSGSESKKIIPLKYSDTSSERTLDVDLDYVYDPKEVGKKPSVYVGVGNIDFKKQVLDNYKSQSEDTSSTFHTTQAATNITIKHIATSPDVALQLGVQSMHFFAGVRTLMMTAMPNIKMYDLRQLSDVKMVDPNKVRVFYVDLSIVMAFDTDWETRIESHRIKDIIFTGAVKP